MKVRNDIVDARMQDFLQACGRLGLKATHQRIEIFREVASTETHPNVLTIYRGVRKRIPTISLDTVYRNLRMLADEGLLAVAGMSRDSLRFDANMEPHHHFICIGCGLIRDFKSDALPLPSLPEEVAALGDPISMHVEVKGYCVGCKGKTGHRRA